MLAVRAQLQKKKLMNLGRPKHKTTQKNNCTVSTKSISGKKQITNQKNDPLELQ